MSLVSRWLGAVLLAWLLAGCGGGGDGPSGVSSIPAQAGTADIGPAGGSVSAVFEGGASVTLTVPAGAVAATTTFRVDPATTPSDAKSAMSMSPAGLEFKVPATLSITLPSGSDPGGMVATFDILGSRVPIGAFDVATRTMTVDLRYLGIGAAEPSAATGQSAGRATARSARARPDAAVNSNTAIQLMIQSGSLDGMVLLFEKLATTFSNNGTRDNAVLVEEAFGGVFNMGINNGSSSLYAEMLLFATSWGNVTCGQLTFAVSTLNSASTSQLILPFNQAVKDVMVWGQLMQDFFILTNQLGGTKPAVTCPALQSDIRAPVRAAFPTYLTKIADGLALLDPVTDLNQIVTARLKELVTVAATLQGANLDPESNQLAGLIAGQFRRVRQGAYDDCRLNQSQISQRDLLILAMDLTFDFIRPFTQTDLLSDIEFCGMSIGWELRDASGTTLQSGTAGGSATAGITTPVATLNLTGADKLVIKGPLSALMCPGSAAGATTTVSPHSNNEQLGFNAGPLGGTLSSVGLLTPANDGRYLGVSKLELPVAQLKTLAQPTGSGNGELDIQRQRDTCFGEFPNFSQHHRLAQFVLNFAVLQITTSTLPSAINGFAYSTTLAATGGTAPITWTATGLPAGLNLDASTGVISGTPTAAGTFTVTIAATSADGLSAQKSLALGVAAQPVYEGSLTESIDQTAFTQCFGSVCQTATAAGRDDYTGLRFVMQANGSFVATGAVAHSSRSDVVSTDGCHDTITETGSGAVTEYTGTRGTNEKGSIVAMVSVTRTVISAACRGSPASSSSSISTSRFVTSSDFLQPVLSGGVLVQLVWNGGFTDNTNTTFKSLGEVHLVP